MTNKAKNKIKNMKFLSQTRTRVIPEVDTKESNIKNLI